MVVDALRRRIAELLPRAITTTRTIIDRDELPEHLDRKTMYLIGTEQPKWAVLDCPCGRGHRLELDLQRSHRPHWRLTRGERGPSIAPSVWLTVEPYCHFWLSSGRIYWVRRRGRPPGPAGRHP